MPHQKLHGFLAIWNMYQIQLVIALVLGGSKEAPVWQDYMLPSPTSSLGVLAIHPPSLLLKALFLVQVPNSVNRRQINVHARQASTKSVAAVTSWK